jgi:dienelactone hydrolase
VRRKLLATVVAGMAVTGLLATVAAGQPGSAARAVLAPTAQVIVQDVRVPVAGHAPVAAYLVRTGGAVRAGSEAGILWLHWLGQIHSDRTEFLAEAVQLASHGVVSLLPQGTFPWQASPVGTKDDVTAVRNQLSAFRACLDALFANQLVDSSRVAIVGHDYGAMYGALLANEDPRVSAAVLATPDATWGHWFAKYWLGYRHDREAGYDALFAALQPVDNVSRLGSRALFQWAGHDMFVSAGVRGQFAHASPLAAVDLYGDADHQLTTQAQTDRDAFLEHVLNLSP